jgi:5S rRNA maturation endonuclease (ribonuclease M5)
LGLETGENYAPENPFSAKRRAIRQQIEDDEALAREAFHDHLPVGSQPWEHGSFRGIPEEYLLKLDSRRYYDDQSECYRIVFPVTNRNGVRIGSVARRLDDGRATPWKNSPGPWARKALFPLELMPRPLPSVVLVEGPFDAIRLNYHGIPTLSILGTQNWSPQKISILNSRRVSNLIICMDGDKAGRKATAEIFEDTEHLFKRKRFMLPIDEDNPIDPGNMDEEKIETLREFGGF